MLPHIIYGDIRSHYNKGPMGTRLLNEKLVFHIGEQVQELKKLVQVNKNTLVILKGSLDAPDEMKKLTSQLTDVQTLLQVKNFFLELYEIHILQKIKQVIQTALHIGIHKYSLNFISVLQSLETI
jgi:hypothetical protein